MLYSYDSRMQGKKILLKLKYRVIRSLIYSKCLDIKGLIFGATFECASKVNAMILQNHAPNLAIKLRKCISIYFGCSG